MSEINGEVKTGVFGGIIFVDETQQNKTIENAETISGEPVNVGTIRGNNLPAKVGFWQKFKAFWLQEIDWNKEIKVELTPKQQKIENEVNEFLHQEITWEKVHNFLFQEVKFGKRK